MCCLLELARGCTSSTWSLSGSVWARLRRGAVRAVVVYAYVRLFLSLTLSTGTSVCSVVSMYDSRAIPFSVLWLFKGDLG